MCFGGCVSLIGKSNTHIHKRKQEKLKREKKYGNTCSEV